MYKFISTDTKVNLTPVAEQSIARRKALNKEIINQDSEDYQSQQFKAGGNALHDDSAVDLGEDEGMSQLKYDAEIERQKVEKEIQKYADHSFVIPSCSNWFNFDAIHELEMQSLPEFFCDKFPQKTPEVYMSSRNFIIKLYRERPTAYLSATGKNYFPYYFRVP